MTIINDYQPSRNIYFLPESDLPEAHAFIQGAVYCWCRNTPDEAFAVSDLFSGVNPDWSGTPLHSLYAHWSSLYREQHPDLSDDELHEKASEQTAIEVEWLVKSVLQDDEHEFESCDAGMAKGYKWVGEKSLRKYRERMFGNGRCKCGDQAACKKGKNCYCKKAKAALDRAHEIRQFEIELLWKRTAYMATIQTILFAALGASFSANTHDGLTVHALRVIVCVVGGFLALFWFWMNQGSKFWYENWENHIDFLECEFEGNLHKTVFSRNKRKPFSVSRINMSISVMFVATWCILAALFLLDFIREMCFWQCFWAQHSYIVYLALMVVLFAICLSRCCGLHTQFRGVANRGCGTEENKVFLVEQNPPTDLETSSLDEVGIWAKICQISACLKRKIQRCKSCRQQTDGGK